MIAEQKKWPYPQPKTYYDVKRSQRPICVNQGGSRSGKTWSTLQVICEFCRSNPGKGYIISVVRKTTPALKASAYRDFQDILIKEGWYHENYHNKTEMTYMLFGNMVEFFATDQPQKLRGRRRHICFINEANELNYEEFVQLNLRTEFKMILDFNPSDETHWIYDLPTTQLFKAGRYAGKTKVDYYITNYTHNPHLGEGLISNIESLEGADDDYWKVFGLGLRGSSREIIFTHWQYCDELPGVGEAHCYGLDFGFNVPSALVHVEFMEDSVYVDEKMYQTKLITSDIADHMDNLGITYSDDIWCDAAAADSIEELQRRNFDAQKALKDVVEGINTVKSKKLFITRRSFNLAKELRNYKWKKDKNTERILDEPVKFNDHAVDAMRYAIYSHYSTPRTVHSYASPMN